MTPLARTACMAFALSFARAAAAQEVVAPLPFDTASDNAPIAQSYRTEPPPPLVPRRSTFAVISGTVIVALGGTAMGTGLGMLLRANGAQTCRGDGCALLDSLNRHTLRTAGWLSLASGAVLTGAGIPLIVWGARRDPTLNLALAPSSASLTLRF